MLPKAMVNHARDRPLKPLNVTRSCALGTIAFIAMRVALMLLIFLAPY